LGFIFSGDSDDANKNITKEKVTASSSLKKQQISRVKNTDTSGARDRVYELLLNYPAVGSKFDESTSPCWEKRSPEANNPMNPGFYCERLEFNQFTTSLSNDFKAENPNLVKPQMSQSFKYREDGTLNSMMYGMFNAFASADDAAQFILKSYSDLELKHDRLKEDVYNEEGISLKIDFSFSDPVLKWNERQLSFGCDAYPDLSNGMNKIAFGDPRQDEWQGMFKEVLGHLDIGDIAIAKFTDFEINKNSVDRSGESRCVLATIFYGDRKVTTLGQDPRTVVEVAVAEIDPRFALTNWD
jgi:hypothetical protein